MKILFIHQNFPAQFRHIVDYLVKVGGHEVLALKQPPNRVQLEGVGVAAYRFQHEPQAEIHPLLQDTEAKVLRGEAVADALLRINEKGYKPDVIVVHPGWGEALFIKDVWPDVKLICYFEYFYNSVGQEYNFDPEFEKFDIEALAKLRMKKTAMLQALDVADAGWTPTKWQQKTFPKWAQSKIQVLHEGIDTEYFKPNPKAKFRIDNKNITLTRKDEVITYAARSLEPVRGFHTFMRALPELMAQRPNAHVVIMGKEQASYGAEPEGFDTWQDMMLDEVGVYLDPGRVHLVGFLNKDQYREVLQVSKAHVYLTYPFILSWSLLEAMACGAPIVASATAPVKEFIRQGKTGSLFEFFDGDALVNAVIKQLDAKPAQSGKVTQAARELVVNEFNQIECVKRLLTLIEATISK